MPRTEAVHPSSVAMFSFVSRQRNDTSLTTWVDWYKPRYCFFLFAMERSGVRILAAAPAFNMLIGLFFPPLPVKVGVVFKTINTVGILAAARF